MGLCLKLRYCSQYSYVLLIIFRFIMLLYLIKPKRKYYDGIPFSKQMVLFCTTGDSNRRPGSTNTKQQLPQQH